MNVVRFLLVLFFCTALPARAQVKVTQETERITVDIDGKPFTVFYIGGKDLNRPYLHPLRAASGTIVNRSVPAGQRPGETIDHPHHAGLFYGHGDVNGYNYWAIQNVPAQPAEAGATMGRIVLKGVASVKSGKDSGSVDVVLDWLTPDGRPLLTETRKMTFHAHPELRIIDFDFDFAAIGKVVFRDTKEGTFALRVATVLEELVPKGKTGPSRTGKLVNAQGGEGEANVWGKRSEWVDYSGQIDGEAIGVVMMDHPGNPRHPTYWHSRGYGLHSINPFGLSDFLGDKTQNGSLTIEPGGHVRFRYRVIVHPGAAPARIAELYQQYAQPTTSPSKQQDASPFRDLDRYALGYAYPGSQLKDHIYERSHRLFAAGDAQRDGLGTVDAVRQRQENTRRLVIAGLGGLPAADTPLNPRVTGTVEGDGFRIEKIIFESRPRHYVTANLYLPLNRRAGRTAAVLFLSGHHDTAKVAPEYQNVCQTLVRAGLIVLAQDPVGQGERLSYFEPDTNNNPVGVGTRDHDYAGAQGRFLGDTLAGYMLHDAMRGIDYLISRPEVDAAKIGVTGNSGGGTQTSLVMLADPRVAAAAPATFIMNRDTYQRTGQPQDAEQIWPGFTGAGLDHEDILLAMAPKPVLVLAVTSDFFPIEGTRRTVTRARRIWELAGRGAALELVEDESTHAYTPKLARAAARFFAQHLLGRRVDLAGFEPKAFTPEQLHSTKSGQVRAEFADAEFVFDATAARLKEAEAARAALTAADRKARAHEWLRGQVLRQRDNTPLNPRRIDRGRAVGAFTVDIAFWYPQSYLANLGMLIRPRERRAAHLPVTIAIWDEGTAALSAHTEWITAECARGRAVFVVNLSGMGPLKPDAINQGPTNDVYGTWRKLSDDLEWMGDSMVALRTYQTLRSIDVLGGWPELDRADVRFYAEGRVGVHAKLAAALAPKVKGCEWQDGFTFADFVRTRSYDAKDIKPFILPGVLRYFDVDEL